jgi:hypothetical protein
MILDVINLIAVSSKTDNNNYLPSILANASRNGRSEHAAAGQISVLGKNSGAGSKFFLLQFQASSLAAA